ncbi:hypothetical protein EVAR_61975_1 [Eumeta japonica]|uniref:Uncharacterized protein n=1 Tax=Eumeta variegata TaxID=151549 RepID=A0A4C1ZU63_EUMVA|nr:hypothetical protein EVAR_61975_1 [Eumeta japonica]
MLRQQPELMARRDLLGRGGANVFCKDFNISILTLLARRRRHDFLLLNAFYVNVFLNLSSQTPSRCSRPAGAAALRPHERLGPRAAFLALHKKRMTLHRHL